MPSFDPPHFSPYHSSNAAAHQRRAAVSGSINREFESTYDLRRTKLLHNRPSKCVLPLGGILRSFEHKRLIQTVAQLDDPPDDPKEFAEWLKAGAHLDFLRTNALADELVVYASGPYTFVHSIVVPNELLSPLDEADLLGWNCNPYTSIASYVSGGGREDVWIERNCCGIGSKVLQKGIQLIFGRTFQGWSGPDRTYYELHQEYSHLAGIHWRAEHGAYCRFDQNGDIEHVVSITGRHNEEGNVALASFKWAPLEDYLAASNSSLVRMYDFTLLRHGNFTGWPDGPEEVVNESQLFFYRRKIAGQAAYTRGIQIVGLRRSQECVFKDMDAGWVGKRDQMYADFIAHDWRNDRVTNISTDPAATTNYFEAENNVLPYELSPAFFRPEVLLKYKSDHDKYTVGERDISCRDAWHLRGIDVNDAGQVHAYICDLRSLPYSEQLYWKAFNEKPMASISQRAIVHDLEGKFVAFSNPLNEVLEIVRRWHSSGVSWWVLRDEKLLTRVNVPHSSSSDEWAEAFMDLAKLVNEGFEVKKLRTRLRAEGIEFGGNEGSISLLERLLNNRHAPEGKQRLDGLRTTQQIRSVVKGHAGSKEAQKLTRAALAQHETFANHFRYVCSRICDELEQIDTVLSAGD